MVEAVWGEHKSPDQIVCIARELLAAGETVLVTRVTPAKADAVLAGLERLGCPDGDARPDTVVPVESVVSPASRWRVMVQPAGPGRRARTPF